MSKILEFPTTGRKSEVLREQLLKQTTSLDEMYEELDDLHAQLHDLEELASLSEKHFDIVLKQYVALVGVGNLEVELLGYSQNTKVVPVEDSEGRPSFAIEWAGEEE